MSTTTTRPSEHAQDASTTTVRGLKPRQLTMMGLGGAIGAGLFLGSGKGVAVAGPAILVSYIVAGALVVLVMWMIGELSAANPTSGAFSAHAQNAFGPVAGYTVGWLYWVQLAVVTAAEANGAATILTGILGESLAGIAVPTGCERGLCKACVTTKLGGTTHLESEGPAQERITVCNTLACSDIELDL